MKFNDLKQVKPNEVTKEQLELYITDLRQFRTLILDSNIDYKTGVYVNRVIYFCFLKLLHNNYLKGGLFVLLSKIIDIPNEIAITTSVNTGSEDYFSTYLLAATFINSPRFINPEDRQEIVDDAIVLAILSQGIFYTGLLMLSALKSLDPQNQINVFKTLMERYSFICVGKNFGSPDNPFYIAPHILEKIIQGNQEIQIYIFDELIVSGDTLKEIIKFNLKELIGEENMRRTVVIESNRKKYTYRESDGEFVDANGKKLWN